ncbi:MAG: hypothetical protein J6H18_01885 [Lachnospiraceae bacterium]|nr:hypothetical protein [Lachnospiraceae bacterium]
MGGFQLKDSKLRDSTPSGESVHWQTVSREVEKLGVEINREISRINLRVLRDEGDEKEQTLMTHYPVLEYDYSNNGLVVKMVAEDSQGREAALQLFQELISDKEGIQFRFITSDEFVEFIDY